MVLFRVWGSKVYEKCSKTGSKGIFCMLFCVFGVFFWNYFEIVDTLLLLDQNLNSQKIPWFVADPNMLTDLWLSRNSLSYWGFRITNHPVFLIFLLRAHNHTEQIKRATNLRSLVYVNYRMNPRPWWESNHKKLVAYSEITITHDLVCFII